MVSDCSNCLTGTHKICDIWNGTSSYETLRAKASFISRFACLHVHHTSVNLVKTILQFHVKSATHHNLILYLGLGSIHFLQRGRGGGPEESL